MDRVLEVLWEIKRKPKSYLPESSLRDLQHFLSAYYTRVLGEGVASEISSIFKGFELWLGDRFEILVQSRSVYDIVESYSDGPEEALINFFELFEQFRLGEGVTEAVHSPTASRAYTDRRKMDLFEILKRIRETPELYIGYPHLAGVNSYLNGYERAGRDLELPQTQDEKLFSDFKRWVEKDRFPRGRARPWFKLIRFHSAHDCGLTPGSAYSVFFKLLDEFVMTNTHGHSLG